MLSRSMHHIRCPTSSNLVHDFPLVNSNIIVYEDSSIESRDSPCRRNGRIGKLR